MIKKIPLFIAVGAVLFVGACSALSTNSYTRTTSPMFFAALDSAPNGAKGELNDGALYLIQKTRAKSNLLCRDVQVVHDSGVRKQTYCKIKGGEWR